MTPRLFKVYADHPSPAYQLRGVLFGVDTFDHPGRVGSCRDHLDNSEYWAILPKFGCGKSRSTPEEAIHELVVDNGCTNIRIEPEPSA